MTKIAIGLPDSARISLVGSRPLDGLTLFQSYLLQTHPAIEVLDHPITFAGGRFEVFPVQDPNGSAKILDQTSVFEDCCGETYAGPAGAEHLGEKVMR